MDNDFRQYAVFDGNPWISPMMVIFGIFGILLIATVPPVGIVLLVIAWQCQRRKRRRIKGVTAQARAEYLEREERARIQAFRSL